MTFFLVLQLHEQEMKELQALIGQDSYKDNRKFWESEMSNAIRELQNEFDRRLDHQNQQMQSYYQMKVSYAAKSCFLRLLNWLELIFFRLSLLNFRPAHMKWPM